MSLWLTDGMVIPLDLVGSYERTCRDPRIP